MRRFMRLEHQSIIRRAACHLDRLTRAFAGFAGACASHRIASHRHLGLDCPKHPPPSALLLSLMALRLCRALPFPLPVLPAHQPTSRTSIAAQRAMATVHSGIYKNHQERTAAEPRRPNVHQVELARIDQVNDSVRLLRLRVADQARGVEVSTPSPSPLGQARILMPSFCSKVLRRPMARYLCSRNPKGRRLYHNFDARGCSGNIPREFRPLLGAGHSEVAQQPSRCLAVAAGQEDSRTDAAG